jgi:hypothetical protein
MWRPRRALAHPLIAHHNCFLLVLRLHAQAPGVLVALPGRGWAPYLIVPEGYYALVTVSGAEAQTPTGKPVWPAGFISAGSVTPLFLLPSRGTLWHSRPLTLRRLSNGYVLFVVRNVCHIESFVFLSKWYT